MIQEFVDRFMAAKGRLADAFSRAHPVEYKDVVRAVIEAISDPDTYDDPDPDRIHVLDDGDYQGTLLFVVAAKGYQPSTYWFVKVGYGSCSGCDTLESIRHYGDGPPTAEEVADYLTLALHVVQGLKPMDGDPV